MLKYLIRKLFSAQGPTETLTDSLAASLLFLLSVISSPLPSLDLVVSCAEVLSLQTWEVYLERLLTL